MITLAQLARVRTLLLRHLRRPLQMTPSPQANDSAFGLDTCGAMLTFVTTRGTRLAALVKVAATFNARRRGLLDHKVLRDDEGLLLSPGGSVHTFGLRYAVDVLFLDKHMRVLSIVLSLQPWRFALAPVGTSYVLELAGGRTAATNVQPGDRLLWSEVEVR